MSHPKNSDVVKCTLQSLCTVAGRRSSEKFANNVMSAIIKTLERKYVFLKYVKIEAKSSTDSIVVSPQIDSFELSEVCKAVGAVIRVVQLDLKDTAGLFLIKEFEKYAGEEVISTIINNGVDLDIMQLEQQHFHSQRRKKKFIAGDVSLLGYTWGDVSSWKYDDRNKVCVLYNKAGGVLDQLNLDVIIKNHVDELTKIDEDDFQENAKEKIELSEKEFKLLKMMHSQDIDVEMAVALLHVSREELDQMIRKLTRIELLRHIDFDVVTLTEVGINYLAEKKM
jgi:uncharacterized protein YlbG (UPF0298 family)